jgi:hypothetical protein
MCAKQVINVGSAPNSNDGDALRIAFQKCVSNFDELYTDDTNDVNSIVATSPIARDNATGVVTISLNDAGIVTDKIADDAVTTDKLANAINSAITANTAKVTNATHTGDVTGSGALTIVDDKVITSKILDANVTTAKIANDAITSPKVGAEFTTIAALTAASTIAVDYTSAQVFTLTPGQSTVLNLTNPVIGVSKTFIVTGAGGSYTLGFQVGGASGTFNKIAGDYDNTSSTKNFVQITCVAATEFWYSISQIAS